MSPTLYKRIFGRHKRTLKLLPDKRVLDKRVLAFLGIAILLVAAGFFWQKELFVLGEQARNFLVSRKEILLSEISLRREKPLDLGEESVEIALPEGIAQKAPETGEERGGGERYLEVAERGEGITHLARRALKKYLQENPQPFEVTPEHKVFIEDYTAKQKSGGWLELGEEIEFSEDLIEEALGKAEKLTPDQLENLTQYSQLIPSLYY